MTDSLSLSEKEKTFLLKTARKSLEHYFKNHTLLVVRPSIVPFKRLLSGQPCFVTLFVDGKFWGAGGSFRDGGSLVSRIIVNTFTAAFSNQLPLSVADFHNLKINISIINSITKLAVVDEKSLLKKITPSVDGIVLEYKGKQGIFMPSSWKDFPTKESFLTHLCLKSGLEADTWKNVKSVSFLTFETEDFSD